MESNLQQNLKENEKLLLEEIQLNIPLVSHPYAHIGKRCRMSEEVVIEKLRHFLKQGIIRELSAIFNSAALGYKSTLVAVRAEEDDITTVAERINSHPGVSHNYLRDNDYNIWFTLTVQQSYDFENEIGKLFDGIDTVKYIILPAIKTFKIGVHFPLTGRQLYQTNHALSQHKKSITLSEFDRKLVVLLQKGLPIVKTPWQEIAMKLRTEEQSLLSHISKLKKTGVIKRISAVLRHRKIGFHANGMACFRVPEDRIVEAGRCLAEYREISHCYQRKTYPEWQYSLFAMVHKRERSECLPLIEEMAMKIKSKDYLALFSIKEFKKERVKYFVE